MKVLAGRICRTVAAMVVGPLVAMVIVVASPTASHADASVISVYSTSPSGVPVGWLTFSVTSPRSPGTTITSMRASWRQPSLCNWRIDWRIYYRGATWWRDIGPAHNHCDSVTGERYRGSGYAPDGSQLCAQLYNTATGVRITSACVGIER